MKPHCRYNSTRCANDHLSATGSGRLRLCSAEAMSCGQEETSLKIDRRQAYPDV